MNSPSNPDTAGDWYATDLSRMETQRTCWLLPRRPLRVIYVAPTAHTPGHYTWMPA